MSSLFLPNLVSFAEPDRSRNGWYTMHYDPEQIKQEITRAALHFFELNPIRQQQIIMRELPLCEEEARAYTHKFSVVFGEVGLYAALVYRQITGFYLVEEANNEEVACEALESQYQEEGVRQV